MTLDGLLTPMLQRHSTVDVKNMGGFRAIYKKKSPGRTAKVQKEARSILSKLNILENGILLVL